MSRVNPVIFHKLQLEMSKNEVLDRAFLARIDRNWEGALGERELQYLAPIDLLLDHSLDKQKGVLQGNVVHNIHTYIHTYIPFLLTPFSSPPSLIRQELLFGISIILIYEGGKKKLTSNHHQQMRSTQAVPVLSSISAVSNLTFSPFS